MQHACCFRLSLGRPKSRWQERQELLRIAAKKGRAVLFFNHDAARISRTSISNSTLDQKQLLCILEVLEVDPEGSEVANVGVSEPLSNCVVPTV